MNEENKLTTYRTNILRIASNINFKHSIEIESHPELRSLILSAESVQLMAIWSKERFPCRDATENWIEIGSLLDELRSLRTNEQLKSDGMDIVDTINDINLGLNFAFAALDKCPDEDDALYGALWEEIRELRDALAEEESKLEVINKDIDWSL